MRLGNADCGLLISRIARKAESVQAMALQASLPFVLAVCAGTCWIIGAAAQTKAPVPPTAKKAQTPPADGKDEKVGGKNVDDKKEPKKKDVKEKKEEQEGLHLIGTLTPKDARDKVRPGCFSQVHTFKMGPGKTYMIELRDHKKMGWDPYLRLENSGGANLMENDDYFGLDSLLMYTPTVEDTYRIVVTTCGAGQTGEFLLLVTPLPAGTPPPPRGTSGRLPTIYTPPPTYVPVTMGDIVISALAPMGTVGLNNEVTHGYVELRFSIENRSEKSAHQVTLSVPRFSHGGRWGTYLKHLGKTVEVGPGSTVQFSMFQPDLPIGGSFDVQVSIDGKVQEHGVSMVQQGNRGNRFNEHYYASMPSTGAGPTIVILAPQELAQKLNDPAPKGMPSGLPSGVPSGLPPGVPSGVPIMVPGGPPGAVKVSVMSAYSPSFHATLDGISSWSNHWLGYSSFDSVAVSGSDLQKGPAEVQAALWQYVECGGTLLIVGACKLPESWERAQAKGGTFKDYYPGFGRCLVSETHPTAWQADDWKIVSSLWTDSLRLPNLVRTATEANNNFPVVSNLGIPMRGLFVFMFLFVIFIGPVNIYWLTRIKRRIWLLWTVPVFSLATCALLFGYMVVSEGWHGHLRAQGITVLDEVSQRAATIGWLGYYSPTTPAGGLHFDQQTELTPHLLRDYRYYSRSRKPLSIDWTSDQHLDSGWVTAKVPAHFLVRRNEKRLERILVRRKDGAVTVVNGLKADLRTLLVAGSDGRLYSAQNIRPGAEATLAPLPDPARAKAGPPLLHEGFYADWLQLSGKMQASPAAFLRPGCYLAVCDDAPFLEQGLRHAQTRKLSSIIYGIMKEPL